MTVCSAIFPWLASGSWSAECLERGMASQIASWIAMLVVAVVIVGSLYHIVAGHWSTSLLRIMRLLAAGAISLSALLLALAAGEPVYRFAPTSGVEHILLVLDQSSSAHRLASTRKSRLDQLARSLAKLGKVREGSARFSLVDFAVGVDIRLNRGSIDDIVALLRQDAPSPSLDPNGSDIGSALYQAAELAQEETDADLILLLSDGNATSVTLDKVAGSFAGRLAGLHILPLDAGAPAEGIVSAYLPPVVRSGSEPVMRAVFDPGEEDIRQNWAIEVARDGKALTLEKTNFATGKALQSFRFPVRFDGRGLQFARFSIGNTEQQFQRRVFTLVQSPIKVLGIGETDFLSVLPKDRFVATQGRDLSLDALAENDILVIGAVEANRLGAQKLEQIKRAVSEQGIGLLLVNGPLVGQAEDPTVVQSYNQTALDPLLPVSPDPKFLIEDPPPRDTIVLVDTSGSMSGGGLAAARSAIADLLIYMRAQDSLQVVTFGGLSSGRQYGDAAGQAAIRDFASRFPTGDSSDVTRAFETALRVTGNYTSVFLITDGDVSPYDYAKAGLSFYYLQYNSGRRPLKSEIAVAARQSQILTSGQGLLFKPDFFDPEEKKEFHTRDEIRPRVVSAIEGISGGISTPGVAFSYARIDAVRALVSNSSDAEPVLAFRRSQGLGQGGTAVFLSDFDRSWTGSQEGRSSIEASLLQLVQWSARGRYAFRLIDFGDELGLEIAVQETEQGAAMPGHLSATLIAGGQTIGIAMTRQSEGNEIFTGRFALPVGKGDAIKGLLEIQEGGEGALEMAQVIPLTLPARLATTGSDREAATFGVNRAGLEALVAATGGAYDRLPESTNRDALFEVPPKPAQVPFIFFAVLLFAFAFLAKGTRL